MAMEQETYIWLCALSLLTGAIDALAHFEFADRRGMQRFSNFVGRYFSAEFSKPLRLDELPGVGGTRARTSAEHLYKYFRSGLTHRVNFPKTHHLHLLRRLVLTSFICAALYFSVVSWRWRLAIDSPVMHYVVFLMQHGLKPYSQISDNNLPGAYFAEAVGMRLFGPDDLGWRLYEFTLLAVMTLAATRIARGWDWTAGIFAAFLFLVLHANEGPQYSGERELTLTVVLLLAYAVLFAAIDRGEPLWMGAFGLFSGFAASIKPTYLPLAVTLTVLALFVLRRRSRPVLAAALYASLGLGLVFSANIAFLLQQGVLREFLLVTRMVTPAYIALSSTVKDGALLSHALPHSGFLLVLGSIPVAITNWRHGDQRNWKQGALLLGAASGLFSFYIQHKGFSHHRYTLCVFVYLLCSIELFRALQQCNWTRPFASILIFVVIVSSPHALRVASSWSTSSDLELSLESDLRRFGDPATINDRVQCFDLVYGCLNALYHLHVVENAGFTGDLLFFSKPPGDATEYYRKRYWRLEKANPPTILVVSNEELLQLNNYNRMERWTEFATYLRTDFQEVVQRTFPKELYGTHSKDAPPTNVPPDGYRMYVRRGSQALNTWLLSASETRRRAEGSLR